MDLDPARFALEGVAAGGDHVPSHLSLEHVDITAAHPFQPVVARSADEMVVAIASIEPVIALSADEMIVAIASVELVVAVAPFKPVVATTAVDPVIAVQTLDGVITVVADKELRLGRAGQHAGADLLVGPDGTILEAELLHGVAPDVLRPSSREKASDRQGLGIAIDLNVKVVIPPCVGSVEAHIPRPDPGAETNHVAMGLAPAQVDDHISALSAADQVGVRAGAAFEHIGAAAAIEQIIAVEGTDQVVTGPTAHGVGVVVAFEDVGTVGALAQPQPQILLAPAGAVGEGDPAEMLNQGGSRWRFGQPKGYDLHLIGAAGDADGQIAPILPLEEQILRADTGTEGEGVEGFLTGKNLSGDPVAAISAAEDEGVAACSAKEGVETGAAHEGVIATPAIDECIVVIAHKQFTGIATLGPTLSGVLTDHVLGPDRQQGQEEVVRSRQGGKASPLDQGCHGFPSQFGDGGRQGASLGLRIALEEMVPQHRHTGIDVEGVNPSAACRFRMEGSEHRRKVDLQQQTCSDTTAQRVEGQLQLGGAEGIRNGSVAIAIGKESLESRHLSPLGNPGPVRPGIDGLHACPVEEKGIQERGAGDGITGDPALHQIPKPARSVTGHRLMQAGHQTHAGDVGKDCHGGIDPLDVGGPAPGGVEREPDIPQGALAAGAGGVGAELTVVIACTIQLAAVGVGGGKGMNTLGTQRGELPRIHRAVAVAIPPESQPTPDGIGSIDASVAIEIVDTQGLKAVGGAAAARQKCVVAEKLGARTNLPVAIEVMDQERVVRRYPAGALGKAVAVVIEEHARLLPADRLDTVAIEIEDEGTTKSRRWQVEPLLELPQKITGPVTGCVLQPGGELGSGLIPRQPGAEHQGDR